MVCCEQTLALRVFSPCLNQRMDNLTAINGAGTPGGVVELSLDGYALPDQVIDQAGLWSATPALALSAGCHRLVVRSGCQSRCIRFVTCRPTDHASIIQTHVDTCGVALQEDILFNMGPGTYGPLMPAALPGYAFIGLHPRSAPLSGRIEAGQVLRIIYQHTATD